jgi:hypothetical protein
LILPIVSILMRRLNLRGALIGIAQFKPNKMSSF